MPVIVCSDKNTDVGAIAESNSYGFWCESVQPEEFTKCVDRMNRADIAMMGRNARAYLDQHYTAEECYKIIMK